MHAERSPLAGQTITMKSGKPMEVIDWYDRASGVENGDQEILYGTDPENHEEYAFWADEIMPEGQ